jgi:hypothetical protein
MYCFPRSGGTLLNQCLLCDPANVVLSEVNPAGSVMPPEEQAASWFSVISPAEAAALKDATYLEKLAVLARRTRDAGRNLCLRDWTGLNFLPQVSPWTGAPSGQLEQRLYLQHAGYALREIALLRRSRAVFDSLRANIPEYRTLAPADFAAAYRRFLAAIAGIEKFHLETLTAEKQTVLRTICDRLQLGYAADFAGHFHQVTTVTGNNTLMQRPASAGWTSIQPQAPSSRPPAAAGRGEEQLYHELDTLAGYGNSQ